MTTWLFVSPHLDDAVLSCAAAIHAGVRGGHRVVVATVFTEGRAHARRRDEDLAAVASLGAEAVHLGLTDAPERLGIEPTHRALVEEQPAGDADVASVRDVLDAAIERVQPARIFVPLGVGEHVDHRVVHAATTARAGVVLYEERPYAFLAGATRARLAALGLAVPHDNPPNPATVREQLVSLPHLRSYLATDDDGARARAWLLARLCEDTSSNLLDRVVVDVAQHDAETASAAVRAVSMYASQLEDLFGGADGIAAALRAASPSAPHTERTFARMPR